MMASGSGSGSETIVSHGKEFEVVREGLAEILKPKTSPKGSEKSSEKSSQNGSSVFYNPIQQFNRDLSVLAIRVFSEDLAAIHEQKSRRRTSRKRKRENPPVEDSHDGLFVDEGVLPASRPMEKSAPTNTGAAAVEEMPDATEADQTEKTASNPAKVNNAAQFRILDALSASGLRAIRYAKEIPRASYVTANDLSPAATQAIRMNVEHNSLSHKVTAVTNNALTHMHQVASETNPLLPNNSRGKYHVVDLDPFGSSAPFLDVAIQATIDGGLLCVTCTDAGVFASTGYMEKTYAQYGGLPLKGQHSHEGGLRLILHAIATAASRYGIAIEPLLSLSIDYYARVFVRVRKSPAEVKLLPGKTMMVYSCDSGCGSWTTQLLVRTEERSNRLGDKLFSFHLARAPTSSPHCEHCGNKTHIGGPMWGGPIHNPYFVQKMLDLLPSLNSEVYGTTPRMEGMLSLARDESLLAESDFSAATKGTANATSEGAPIARLPPEMIEPAPFFFLPSGLASVVHCQVMSIPQLRSALFALGYKVTRSHCKPGSIRTDAPWSVLWEILREWVRQKAPLKPGSLKEGSPGWVIMSKSRENSDLLTVKRDLEKIASTAGTVDEAKTLLQSLLYRIEHQHDRAPGGMNKAVQVEDPLNGASASAPKQSVPVAQLNIVFDEALGKENEPKRLTRYQLNPRENWGPMSKGGS